ncbi:MAG: glycosyltransferase family 39 protein [Verrucomicrobia bacterium]|nr:glycosyltransferase family 39 protein [Verrucomicrobiota bacterium]
MTDKSARHVDDQPKGTKHYTVRIDEIGIMAAKVFVWAVLVGLAVFYFWYKYTERLGVASPEAFEFAQIARNNLRGEWFQTDVIRPIGLWLNPDVHHHPDLFHPPAYSVALAGVMKIFGVHHRAMLWGSVVFYVLTIPVLYFAVRSMYSRRVARLSLFFYAIMPAVGIAAVSGTPAMLAVFLVTSFFALLSIVREKRYLATVAAGLALAACALTATRYVFLVVPGVAFLVLTLKRRAWVHVPILLVVATLGLLPWALRNAQLTGSPWAPMEWTASYQLSEESKHRAVSEMRATLASSHEIEHSFSPEALEITLLGKEGARALARNLRLGLGDLVRYGGQSILIVLCVAGVLVRAEKHQTEWLRIVLYGAVFIELIYGAVARPDSFLLLPFVPLMLVIGTATMLELIRRLGYTQPISRFALIAVGLTLAVLQMLVATNPAEAFTETDRERYITCWALDNVLRETPGPNAVVLSNVPWHTAWYLDRPSIWLPPSYDDLMRLRMQTGEEFTLAFLARYALDERASSHTIWEEGAERGRMPDSFGLGYFYPPARQQEGTFSAYISAQRFEQLLRQARTREESTEPAGDDTRSREEKPPASPANKRD